MGDQVEKKKPRLKFSKLCLSQNRLAESLGVSNTQPNSSQISKFFTNRNLSNENHEKRKTAKSPETRTSQSKSLENCDNEKPTNTGKVDSPTKTNSAETKSKKRPKIDNKATTDKKTIKSFFANESSDSLSDFEVPSKIVKRIPKPVPAKQTKKSRSRVKQSDIRKVLSKNDATNDYSHLPEEAQIELALALSKQQSDLPTSGEAKLDLEKYQYKASNCDPTNSELHGFFNVKRKTTRRHKWNTRCTLLTRRKDDVQEAKIKEKIDELLCNNIITESISANRIETVACDLEDYELHSKLLQRFCMSDQILFDIGASENYIKDDVMSYYTNNLVEVQWCEAGALLRDWSKIPGRDSIYDGKRMSESTAVSEIVETIDSGDNDPENVIAISSESEPIAESQNPSTPKEKEEEEDDDDEMVTQEQIEIIANADEEQPPDECEEEMNVTVILDQNDIQLQVDAINSNIRLSQNFAEVFNSVVVSHEPSTALRAPSPDLFDDDYLTDEYSNEIEIVEAERITNEPSRSGELTENATSVPSGAIENPPTASSDVIVISSEDYSEPFDSNVQVAENKVDEVVVVPNDSPPDLHFQEDFESSIEEVEKTIQNLNDTEDEFERLKKSSTEQGGDENTSECDIENSTEASAARKPLSFTERLKLYEEDIESGFTKDVDIPSRCDQLSQESTALSDDEINFSMNIQREHEETVGNMNDLYLEIDNNHPLEFNLFDPKPNTEDEEKLVNESVCNIFERTLDHVIESPIIHKPKTPPSSRPRTFKKFQSESIITPRRSMSKTQFSPRKQIIGNLDLPSASTSHQKNSQTKNVEPVDLSDENYIIRVGSVSPKPNFEEMDTDALEMELRKFGLKPSLRRRQAIICLDYIYNRTHPFMEDGVADEANRATNTNDSQDNERVPDGPESLVNFNIGFGAINLVNDKFKTNETTKVYLPSCPRAKKPWCLEPLHIAWHNLITANPELNKILLLYEPFNLLDLKKFFKTIEMTFDNRDLIAFLDQHCITFRMNRNTKQ